MDRTISIRAEDARAELYVHALAQLPDEVTLEIVGEARVCEPLLLLARGYAVGDRVRVEQGPGEEASAGQDPQGPPTMAELVEGLTRDGDAPSDPHRDDTGLAGQRVALVTNLPAPYRVPLLNLMSERLTAVGASLRVFFQGAGSKARPWIGSGGDMEFDHETLSSFELPVGGRRPRLPLNLERRLGRYGPSVVVCGGYSPLVAPRVALCARRQGAAFGLWGGEVSWRSTASSRPRHAARKWVADRSDFAIAYGSTSAEYLRSLSSTLPVVLGRNSSSAYALDRDRPARPETVELLAVADMAVPGKGVDLLVDAVVALPDLPCRLTVVGGGADAQRAMVQRAEGDGRIRFLGPLPQARVRSCYAESDVYLFPSRIDVFGLALVEAMGSGLAPIISTRPGAAADLAVHEHNCLAVEQHEASAWAEALERIVTDHDLRLRLGARAKATIDSRWTIEHACEAMFAGLRLGLLAREGSTNGT